MIIGKRLEGITLEEKIKKITKLIEKRYKEKNPIRDKELEDLLSQLQEWISNAECKK